MSEPKLELRKNNRRLARLTLVKQTARNRTNRRIQLINDDIAEQKAKKEGTAVDFEQSPKKTAPKKVSK